jgi:hypothetical protein
MVEASYQWRNLDSDPTRLYLYNDNVQIGGYDIPSDTYRSYDARTDCWGATGVPPYAVPRTYRQNYGVNYRPADRDRVTFQGQPVSLDQAMLAFDSTVPSDANYLRLTVIGTPEQQAQVLNDLRTSPVLQGLPVRVIARGYAADSWVIAGMGYVTTGTPTIYVQTPDGHVVHRQNSYVSASDLATALRRLDPNYNSTADPDLRQGPPFALPSLPSLVLILGAGLALLLISPFKVIAL